MNTCYLTQVNFITEDEMPSPIKHWFFGPEMQGNNILY